MDYKKRDIFGWLRGLWRERRPMVIAAIVLVVGLPVVIVLASLSKDKPSPIVDNVVKQAQRETDDGDYDSAYSKLKAAEGQATTKAQKIALYSELAAAAANAGKTQEAIAYLNQKHQLDPDLAQADAFMLARLYESAGNKTDALAQYKMALEYYKNLKDDPLTAQSTVESIKAAIADLEGNNDQ